MGIGATAHDDYEDSQTWRDLGRWWIRRLLGIAHRRPNH